MRLTPRQALVGLAVWAALSFGAVRAMDRWFWPVAERIAARLERLPR